MPRRARSYGWWPARLWRPTSSSIPNRRGADLESNGCSILRLTVGVLLNDFQRNLFVLLAYHWRSRAGEIFVEKYKIPLPHIKNWVLTEYRGSRIRRTRRIRVHHRGAQSHAIANSRRLAGHGFAVFMLSSFQNLPRPPEIGESTGGNSGFWSAAGLAQES